MALRTEHKLYIAVGILALLAVVFLFQRKQKEEMIAQHSFEGRSADLPKLQITEEQTKKIDKIVLRQPAGDAGEPREVVLVKEKKDDKDERWKLEKPVSAPANDTNVKNLLENLTKLELREEISPRKESWSKYGVTDDQALHATFYQGKDVVLDAYFGESGSRGQMTRLRGKDAVYAVSGYSSWLYKREVKEWRDRKIFEFDEDKARTIEVSNEHGRFVFTKEGEQWKGKFEAAKLKGVLKEIERFDESKVKDLLRTYKSLNADAFGDDKKPAEVGLDKPLATITITLEDGGKRQLLVGANAQGESRWAKKPDADQIYSITSWTSEWVTSNVEKYQKPEEKDEEKKKDEKKGSSSAKDEKKTSSGSKPEKKASSGSKSEKKDK